MAQTGYSPISLYYSTTASAVPTNTNLVSGELAINITDGKLYYKDNGGTVRLLAQKGDVVTPITNNGVVYVNSSGQATTGSALTFDGTNLTLGANKFVVKNAVGDSQGLQIYQAASDVSSIFNYYNGAISFGVNNTEQMRLTTTGLGIGLGGSNPARRLDVQTNTNDVAKFTTTIASDAALLTMQGGSGVRAVFLPSNATGAWNWQLAAQTNVNASFEITPSTASGGTTFSNPVYTVSNVGLHKWFNGTTQAMTLDASGNLQLGIASGSGNRLNVVGSGGIRVNEDGAGTKILTIRSDYAGVDPAINVTTNNSLLLMTNNTIQATLSATGNLGLGVTPSAWLNTWKAFQIGPAGSVQSPSDNTLRLSYNSYYDGAAYKRLTASAASYFIHNTDSSFSWLQAGSSTAGSNISWTTAMTLDASGNLVVGGTSAPLSAANRGNITINGASTSILNLTVGGTSKGYLYHTGTDMALSNSANGFLSFDTNATERARIDSSGNLLVGTTSQVNSEKANVTQSSSLSTFVANNTNASFVNVNIESRTTSTTTNGSFYHFRGISNGTNRFIVLDSGNVQNTNNSYGAISDIKLKENIVDATPKLENLMQVRVVNYNLKSDPEHKQIGVVAQEVEQVFPGIVEELSDRDVDGNDLGTTTKSVKYSVFVPMLIKALQEMKAIIDDQAARIAALEAK